MTAGARVPPGAGLLASLYGWVTVRRRRRFHHQPTLARRLSRPVISIGNLTVGGSGKTPLVVALAAALQARGERPAVLSRGYARRAAAAGVTVVSDRAGLRVPVEVSGDEPQLIARRLPGVPVVVAQSRYEAGLAAEREHDCTVHLLDDGFQHLQLARAVNLLVLSAADLTDRVLPAGRLREPVDAAWAADAWLVGDDPAGAFTATLAQVRPGVVHPPVFTFTTRVGPPRAVHPFGEPAPVAPGPAVALTGIARPERFHASLRAAGWTIARTFAFRDHHWFTDAEWTDIMAAARAAGAAIVTTEKDAVRLTDRSNADVPVVYLPLDAEPSPALLTWLAGRLGAPAA